MRVTILHAYVPFTRGRPARLAGALAARLVRAGHRAEVVRVPFQPAAGDRLLEQLFALRMIQGGAGDPDAVIALQFPACLVPCPGKRVWLVEPFDGSRLPDTPEGRRAAQLAREAEGRHLAAARAVFAGSRRLAVRLRDEHGLDAGVLYPPPCPEEYPPAVRGDYLFYPAPFVRAARQDLAVRALLQARAPARLVLLGEDTDPAYRAELEALVRDGGLEDRVRLVVGSCEQEAARWLAGSRAVLRLEAGEDGPDEPLLAAFSLGKPALTCTDCPGPGELVRHGANGLVLEPTADGLAAGLGQLGDSSPLACRLGDEARETVRQLRIDWLSVLEKLLS
jgi:glycosyltransferase involved in cell wall biosynthesis